MAVDVSGQAFVIPYVNHAPAVQQFLAGPEAAALTQRERAEFEGLMLSRLLLENMRGESLGDRFGTEDPAVEGLSGGVGGAAPRL